MKKRITKDGIILILLIIAILICGAVSAFMFKQTDEITNKFDKAIVACEVQETFENNVKSSIQVKNTGNIDAYLRIRLASHWEDSAGNIVAKASSIPSVTLADDWVVGSNNTYYYKKSVAPGELTGELLNGSITLSKSEDGYYQVVEVFAEAIQAEPKKSVEESWSVTLDTDGNITSAP